MWKASGGAPVKLFEKRKRALEWLRQERYHSNQKINKLEIYKSCISHRAKRKKIWSTIFQSVA